MRGNLLFLLSALLLSIFPFLPSAKGYDFFYLVQQWPGSYCSTKTGCCYPKTGKPAAKFGIHRLQPYTLDGSSLTNCNSHNHFDRSKIADLTAIMQKEWPSLACPSNDDTSFWAHEWQKYGTCSESVLNQHGYFKAAVELKKKVDLVQVLQNAGIKPNGGEYSIDSIKEAIRGVVGYEPGVECNVDKSGKSAQLYQIYLCASTQGSTFIDCPGLPNGKCSTKIKFPPF